MPDDRERHLIDAVERTSRQLTVGLPVLHLPLSADLAHLLQVRKAGPLSRTETAKLRACLAAALDMATGRKA